MDYSVSELAKLSGVSRRTLHYYDSIDLLKPQSIKQNGYRVYTSKQIDTLQQILFYKELGFELSEIKTILLSDKFDYLKALLSQLDALKEKQKHINTLIENVTKTISSLKGETTMTDNEKFEGFKKSIINKNEKLYGREIRKKYGDSTVDEFNLNIINMSKDSYENAEELSNRINDKLKEALLQNDPSSAPAQEACCLHEQWIKMYWGEKHYSKQAHLQLGKMYTADERFKKYYDAIGEGAAELLYKALKIYCTE